MAEALVALPDGVKVVRLGLGTWMMAEKPSARSEEIRVLRAGVEAGLTLVDTAEMYGEGKTETLVGEALAGLRDKVFLVSKVCPHHASREGTVAACEASLKRLNTDRLDLYLLHWPGGIPLAETIAGFEALKSAGKIRHWGVSNFDTEEMETLFEENDATACATNQILYNLKRRTPEWDLIPWMERRHLPPMAYSPMDQGRLPAGGPLAAAAKTHATSRFTIAIAWLLQRKDTIVIPKTSSEAHLKHILAARDVTLSRDELAALDAQFPPPKRKRPLELL